MIFWIIFAIVVLINIPCCHYAWGSDFNRFCWMCRIEDIFGEH